MTSKWAQKQTVDNSKKLTLQLCEQGHVEKGGEPIPAELFNIMLEMAEHSHDPVKVFHWMKGVGRIERKEDGSVQLHCAGVLFANNLFFYLADALVGHFKTKNISTFYEGTMRRTLSPGDERKLSSATKKLLDRAMGQFNG